MKLPDTFKDIHPRTFRHPKQYLRGGIVTVARYHLAGIFILSGITKAINPFGFSLKLGEYAGALGLDFLTPLAGPGGILLPALELFVGFMLLAGISRRAAGWMALLFTGFFTILTFWLAVADPISDCGCFGDVIRISNRATFGKNLLFLLWAVIFFQARRRERERNPSKLRSVVIYAIFIPLSLSPGLYSWHHLPILDPSPFRTGVNIPTAMIQREDSEVQTVLIYRSRADGKRYEFGLEDTTWYDASKWEYVDTKTIGNSIWPEITGVPMIEGTSDRSEAILSEKGYTVLAVVNRYNPELFRKGMLPLSEYIHRWNGRVVALSATALPEDLKESGIEPLSSDLTVLRTMMQQKDGGILLLHGGTIIGKLAFSDLSEMEWEADSDPISHVLTAEQISVRSRWVSGFWIAMAMIVLAVHFRFQKNPEIRKQKDR